MSNNNAPKFVPFVKPEKSPKPAKVAKVAKPPREPKVAKPRRALATVERTTGNGFILHISVVACRELGLVVGDKIVLGYDPASGRVGFMKDNKRGTYTLNVYGGNPDRLKVGITDFMKAKNLARHVTGQKVQGVVKDRDGWATIQLRGVAKPAPEPVAVEPPAKPKRSRKPAETS